MKGLLVTPEVFAVDVARSAQRGHLSAEGEVSEADEELLCKPVCVDLPVWYLNRSLRHLGTEFCAANMPSTSVDFERESFGTSSCRCGFSIDAPQKISLVFLRFVIWF